MNKQRKVVITTTYNEMGIIIDTKVEEVAQPNLQPTCNQLATDTISRQAAIDAISCDITITGRRNAELVAETIATFADRIKALPSAQLDTYWKEQCQSYEQTINKLRESLSTQPEIIRCRECKFASGDSRICMKFDHSPIGELDFCSFAERREVTT